jgi:hypothetical protein
MGQVDDLMSAHGTDDVVFTPVVRRMRGGRSGPGDPDRHASP